LDAFKMRKAPARLISNVVSVKKRFKATCFTLFTLNRKRGIPASKRRKKVNPPTRIIVRCVTGMVSKYWMSDSMGGEFTLIVTIYFM